MLTKQSNCRIFCFWVWYFMILYSAFTSFHWKANFLNALYKERFYAQKISERYFCTVTTNQLAHSLIEPLPKAKLTCGIGRQLVCQPPTRNRFQQRLRFNAPLKKIYQIKSKQNKEGLPKWILKRLFILSHLPC